MPSVFSCEIRLLRGVPVVLPDGTDFLVRALFSEGVLPASFRTLRRSVSLLVAAERVSKVEEDLPEGIEPAEGIPVGALGAVTDREGDDRIIIDVGFPLLIVLPAGIRANEFQLGARVRCELTGSVRADVV